MVAQYKYGAPGQLYQEREKDPLHHDWEYKEINILQIWSHLNLAQLEGDTVSGTNPGEDPQEVGDQPLGPWRSAPSRWRSAPGPLGQEDGPDRQERQDEDHIQHQSQNQNCKNKRQQAKSPREESQHLNIKGKPS